VGGPGPLAWLADGLRAAGAAVAPVTYDDDGAFLVDDAEQALAAREALRAELGPDAPVVVAGHSRGGTVALLAAATQEGWSGVAALSPTTDQVRLVAGLRDFAPSRYAQMIAMRGCTPEEDPGYYRRTSPLHRAGTLRVPVLLLHGDTDLVVPHDHSLWMAEALADAGHDDVEVVVLPGVGHFFERNYTGYVFDDVVEHVSRWALRTATS
jgi:dipeptidyl aminopeptidase/acylaminoacyl peptidase